jgi:hypothetical protein
MGPVIEVIWPIFRVFVSAAARFAHTNPTESKSIKSTQEKSTIDKGFFMSSSSVGIL